MLIQSNLDFADTSTTLYMDLEDFTENPDCSNIQRTPEEYRTAFFVNIICICFPFLGGFQLEFVSISQVIDLMSFYNLSAFIGGKFIFYKKNPLQDLLNSLNQKYSRLRCLLRVKGLVIGFYLGWSGHTLLIRKI